ncbi:RloB family protein [Streptomyces sp. FH025]|uniref:RloB family protein n=1 Tax=Streptomyces sp. FH025 TaxID=2815937 RepID=UPI001A9FE9DE|nr:RloB family protein [Streptomyces sp. FH025]MBO1417865.1 RloB domain-containing protein [Streptomyces sp. FH025]
MARATKPSGRKRPSFDTQLGRKSGYRESRQRLLVVCGAKVTESNYLNGLRSSARNPAVSVKIVEHPKSPSQVVEHAEFLRDRAGGEYDETWCVLDVDEFPNLDQTVIEARRKNIEVAFSNPCFEVWLLLHFMEYRRSANSFKELLPFLEKCFPAGYGKTDQNFSLYGPNWRLAATRAKELAEWGEEHKVNPSTGMWKLALAIGGSEPSGGK